MTNWGHAAITRRMAAHAELLRQVSLFRDVDPAELERVESILVEKKFSKDAHIVQQDQPGDALFIIKAGRVKVVIYGDNNREVILNLLKEKEFFGEMSLFDERPRSAHVIASEDTTVLMLTRDQFESHVHRSPSTAINIIRVMSQRLRRADEIIGNLATLDVSQRVIHIMKDLAEKDGEQVPEGWLIKERPTQQDIASMIGTSRETVSRVLSELQRGGFVEMRGRQILLTNKLPGLALAESPEPTPSG